MSPEKEKDRREVFALWVAILMNTMPIVAAAAIEFVIRCVAPALGPQKCPVTPIIFFSGLLWLASLVLTLVAIVALLKAFLLRRDVWSLKVRNALIAAWVISVVAAIHTIVGPLQQFDRPGQCVGERVS